MSAKLSNTKNLVALVLGAVVVLVAAGWFLLIGPERSKATKLDADIVDVQQKIDVRKAALQTPKADLNVRASDVFRLTRAMPDNTDMSGIIVALNRLAARHELAFQSIAPSPLVAQAGFNVQPIAVELQGRFGDVSAFLGGVRELVRVKNHRLATKGRLFSVDSVEVTQPGTDATFPVVKATLTIDAFVFAGGVLPTTPESDTSASNTVAAGAN
jgi:Tfp pilus assembly protein PilO